jgi:hypothetical protein
MLHQGMFLIRTSYEERTNASKKLLLLSLVLERREKREK